MRPGNHRVIEKRFTGFPMPKGALLIFVFLFFPACFHQRSVSRDELRSDLISAASLSAEAETFIDHVRAGRSTGAFAEGHAKYLADEAGRLAGELDGLSAAPADADSLRACRHQVGKLLNELELVRSAIGLDDALASRKNRLQEIRKAIETANTHL
jgi:hypothetical protein